MRVAAVGDVHYRKTSQGVFQPLFAAMAATADVLVLCGDLILSDAGVHLLDGDACEIQEVGFAGAKGLGGGFGERAIQPWGEDLIKRFVRETIDEALKLESALAKLRTPQRVAILHYSPIRETVEGEPYEIFPFPAGGQDSQPGPGLQRVPATPAQDGSRSSAISADRPGAGRGAPARVS